MIPLLLRLLHLLQAAFSLYAGQYSWTAITNLQQYEEKTERAAKWSGSAEYRLHKTRATETSGALAILSSLLSALYLTFLSAPPAWSKILHNATHVVLCLAAQTHIGNFWNRKAKVPLVDGYNAGIQSSKVMQQMLVYLGALWGVSAAVEMLRMAV